MYALVYNSGTNMKMEPRIWTKSYLRIGVCSILQKNRVLQPQMLRSAEILFVRKSNVMLEGQISTCVHIMTMFMSQSALSFKTICVALLAFVNDL